MTKQKSKFKFSLLQGKNNQDCASTKKSILTPQNKPQPIKNVKGINQKNSIKYYKVKNNKIAFKNSSSTIKIQKYANQIILFLNLPLISLLRIKRILLKIILQK